MLFTEPTFLFVFLPMLLALYQLPGARYRNWLLLAASILFYARGAGSFTWLVLGLIAFNYAAARAIDRHRPTRLGRTLLAGTIAVDLLVLAVFKYADFAVGNLNAALALTGTEAFALPGILLPIGISFFTFHAISYVVDVYRQDAAAQKRPVEAALYLLVFPQLVAGPIVRYRQIAAQLSSRVTSTEDFADGVRRFIIGLAKKMLIANTLAGPADHIFAMPAAELTAAHAWTGVVCYTLQIYFDFSGYSDMAIGLGRMFGFRFPENFNYPYIAASIQDFWRRWHMSLSAWFRDYVYIPLGGNRSSTGRLYFNLVLVFFLCGLWHGASWTFVVWGLYHGGFLVFERLLRFSIACSHRPWFLGLSSQSVLSPFVRGALDQERRTTGGPRPKHEAPGTDGFTEGQTALGLPARAHALLSPLRHAYALLVVMVGWVFFRADTLAGAVAMLGAMAGAGGGAPATYAPAWYWNTEVLLALAAGVLGSTPVLPALGRRLSSAPTEGGVGTGRLSWQGSMVAVFALLLILTASILLSASRSYNPFIYFRF